MTKTKYVLTIILTLLLIPIFYTTVFANTTKGLWVWESEDVLSSDSKTNDLVNFCIEKGFNYIYFDISIPFDSKLQNFIGLMHSKNIKVDALTGDNSYIYAKNHDLALKKINEIIQFNNSSTVENRFDGVHFDLEPANLPNFKKDKKIKINYLDLLAKTKNLLTPQNLKFTADIPYWFDSAKIKVTYKGKSKTFDKHIIDLTDCVVIMDYTNISTNQIKNVSGEISYSDSLSKKVVVAVETQLLAKQPSTVSYYDYGEKYMLNHLSILNNYYKNNSSYDGYAIHYYGSYLKLKP